MFSNRMLTEFNYPNILQSGWRKIETFTTKTLHLDRLKNPLISEASGLITVYFINDSWNILSQR